MAKTQRVVKIMRTNSAESRGVAVSGEGARAGPPPAHMCVKVCMSLLWDVLTAAQ